MLERAKEKAFGLDKSQAASEEIKMSLTVSECSEAYSLAETRLNLLQIEKETLRCLGFNREKNEIKYLFFVLYFW